MASEAKHTPGPWVFSQAKYPQDGEYDFAIGAGGKVIAEAFGRVAEGSAGVRPAEANARLIAAAPTLINMVRWAVNHDGECLGDHPELLEAARAAVAEVEGPST